MSGIFWGFFFVFLNFNLNLNGHTINLLPAFVGYWMLARSMDALSGESGLFGALRPFAIGMAVYSAILWVGDALAITSSGPVSMLLGLLSTLVSLYIAWGVSRAVEDMERTHGADLGAVGVRGAWIALAVGEALALLANAVAMLGLGAVLLGILGLVVALVGIVWFLVALWGTKKRFERLNPEK